MEQHAKSIPLDAKLASMRKLSVAALSPTPRELDCLERFAPFCTELLIVVDETQLGSPGTRDSWLKRFTRPEQDDPPGARPSRASWEFVKAILLKEDIGKFLHKVSDAKAAMAAAPAPAPAAASRQPYAGDGKVVRERFTLKTLNQWADMLSKCHCLEMVVIRVNGDKGWATSGKTEDMLSILRTAIEYAGLPKLKHIRFQPVSIMGITQFRWSDAATSTSLAEQATIVWRNVDELDIQLHNPFSTLNESQKSVVLHALHEYLANFATSLRSLRFIWLGDSGPSPLALHKERNLAGLCRPIIWQNLEDVWVGNIRFLDPAVRAIQAYAPSIRRIMTLLDRCAYRQDIFDYQDGWIEFLLGSRQANPPLASPYRHDSGNAEAESDTSRNIDQSLHQAAPRMLDYYASHYQTADDDTETVEYPAWI